MKTKLIIAISLASVVGLVAAGVASAAFVAIYRNALETTAQRSEMMKLSGRSCTRGGGKTTLLITVGKLTEECAYKTPVVGQDLEIAATGQISPATPPAVARKAFLGLQLRAGGGGEARAARLPGPEKGPDRADHRGRDQVPGGQEEHRLAERSQIGGAASARHQRHR